MNIAEELKHAAEVLRQSEIEQPRREAGSLLSLALKRDKAFLISHPEYELTGPEEELFREFVRRRAGREPFQHIAGKQEFYGLDFMVSPDVLIPRPETEMLVEQAISLLSQKKNPYFGEVGVGSGCISVAVLKHLETARALGLDISAKALAIARLNAEKHGVADRLNLKKSDIFAVLEDERFDLIVSNPPYIPAKDLAALQPEVRDFDPSIALTDGRNGLTLIERIINRAPGFLKPDGDLLLEIGIDQADEVRVMFSPLIWGLAEIRPDLQNIPRMVRARIKIQPGRFGGSALP